MPEFNIELTDPRRPEVTDLIKENHAFLSSLYTPEECHHLDISALRGPAISFFAAYRGGHCIGSVALSDKGTYGEIKSLFVRPAARGTGLGAALVSRVEREARKTSLTQMKLETGDKLHAAHRLYFAAGYTVCGPFGDYVDSPASVFLEKRLS